MSSSLNSSNARSTRRISHSLGQSAATVMSPSGGTRERSGTISITSPRLQNEAGKRGQTIRTLIAGPSGGKDVSPSGSRPLKKTPTYPGVESGMQRLGGPEYNTGHGVAITVGAPSVAVT